MAGTLPEAGAKLTLDLSEWESNWSSAMDNADTLTQALDDISGSVDVEVNLDVPDTSEIEDIQALDGETISPELDTSETENSKQIRDGINFLATVEKIKIAIDVVGTALNFIKDVGSMVVTPFLDVEDAVAKINAQTGGTGIEDLGQFIRDIQAADLGESVDQIADVAIKAQQMNLPMQEAATAALTFTHTFKNEDPTAVLKPLADLVKTGLVPDMQTAADLMTVFFQAGGNQGGDALNTVQKYSTAWSDMGLTLSESLSLISSLMAGGVDTSETAAKMIQTADDAFTKAAQDPGSPEANMLRLMGVENPKEQGKAIGADTIDGFVSAFDDLSVEDQDFASKMFFGKGGALNTGAIAGMTTQSDMFKNYKDAAALAATEIDNSLRGAIDDFVLAVNTSIADLLSSDAIDLPGKIAALKEGFQKAVDVLANGGTIGEALEVGLQIQGVDEFITNFQRVVGNLEIALLQIVSTIQATTGHGDMAAITDKEIARLSGKQLSFDLKIANPDEVEGIVAQAVGRGVDPTKIGELAGDAVSELVGSGDFQRAQALVDAFGAVSKTPVDADMGAMMQGQKVVPVTIDVPGLQTEIDEAVEAAKPNPEPGWWNNLKPPADLADTALGKGVGTKSGNAGWWTNFTPPTEAATAVTDTSTAIDTATTSVTESVDTMATGVGTSLDETVTKFADTTTAAQLMDTDIATAMTGNTVTASFEAVALAAQTSFPAVIEWFNKTTQAAVVFDTQVSGHVQHLINLLHDLQFLSAQVATGVQQALTLGAGLGGGGGTTNNNNVTVNNTVNSTAGAAANGYSIGASLRSGGV